MGQISPSQWNWVKGKYPPGHAEQDPRPALPVSCLVWATPSRFALPWFTGGSLTAQRLYEFGKECLSLLFQGEFLSLRGSLASLWCSASPVLPTKKSRMKAKYCVAECNWEKYRWCLIRIPCLRSGSTASRSSFGLGVVSVYSKCKDKWRNRK